MKPSINCLQLDFEHFIANYDNYNKFIKSDNLIDKMTVKLTQTEQNLKKCQIKLNSVKKIHQKLIISTKLCCVDSFEENLIFALNNSLKNKDFDQFSLLFKFAENFFNDENNSQHNFLNSFENSKQNAIKILTELASDLTQPFEISFKISKALKTLKQNLPFLSIKLLNKFKEDILIKIDNINKTSLNFNQKIDLLKQILTEFIDFSKCFENCFIMKNLTKNDENVFKKIQNKIENDKNLPKIEQNFTKNGQNSKNYYSFLSISRDIFDEVFSAITNFLTSLEKKDYFEATLKILSMLNPIQKSLPKFNFSRQFFTLLNNFIKSKNEFEIEDKIKKIENELNKPSTNLSNRKKINDIFFSFGEITLALKRTIFEQFFADYFNQIFKTNSMKNQKFDKINKNGIKINKNDLIKTLNLFILSYCEQIKEGFINCLKVISRVKNYAKKLTIDDFLNRCKILVELVENTLGELSFAIESNLTEIKNSLIKKFSWQNDNFETIVSFSAQREDIENQMRFDIQFLLFCVVKKIGKNYILQLTHLFKTQNNFFNGPFDKDLLSLKVVDFSVELKKCILNFTKKTEQILSKHFEYSIKHYSSHERKPFSEMLEEAKKLTQKNNSQFDITFDVFQRNIPSTMVSVWKYTLLKIKKRVKKRKINLTMLFQMKANLAVIYQCIPPYICREDIAELSLEIWAVLSQGVRCCDQWNAEFLLSQKNADFDNVMRKIDYLQ